MDFYGPFPTGETLFVVIDSYSKFSEVEIMKSTTARAVTNRLDRIFAVHGIPTEIYSDNGPPFASDAVKKFMRNHAINHRLVTPYWLQANGEAESFMKPLGKAVKAAKMEGKDWKEELHGFLLAYRTTPQCTTGVAPSQLLFNREVRTNMPTFVNEGDIDYKI
jgi:transposase InsO family protein